MKSGNLNTRTWRAIVCLLMFFTTSVAAQVRSPDKMALDETGLWTASGGTMRIDFDPGLMDNLGLAVRSAAGAGGRAVGHHLSLSGLDTSSLEFMAPFASFERFVGGGMEFPVSLTFQRGDHHVMLDGLDIRPAGDRVLGLFDRAGHELFRLDYMHIMLYPESSSLEMLNMDMAMSPWFAEQMGVPELADMVVAGVHFFSHLTGPGGDSRGFDDCAAMNTPNWHNGVEYQTDVALIEMNRIQMAAREAGVRVAIAPDAMLQNVGTADVPWYERFTTEKGGTFPDPYGADQHPILVWAMYRVVNDIPQQIGQSAVKHAFFSQNSLCDCQGDNILWAAINTPDNEGCGDLYSYTTNDNPRYLGVRSEIPAFTVEWEQCGSMFAENATPPGPCDEEYDGATSDEFERRLVVEESELQTKDADYLFEAWYVIRDDVNIFNSFAHKTVLPEFTGSMWDFNYADYSTINGPALNSWVAPGTRGANEIHTVETTANGHFSVAVKVSDLGGGDYRYVYALMNYDYDPQFDSFSLELPAGVTVSNDQFLDGDSDNGNDWVLDNSGGMLTWEAPVDVALEWGFMATFVFEADAPPVQANVTLSAFEMELSPGASVLGPGIPPFYEDGFENQVD